MVGSLIVVPHLACSSCSSLLVGMSPRALAVIKPSLLSKLNLLPNSCMSFVGMDHSGAPFFLSVFPWLSLSFFLSWSPLVSPSPSFLLGLWLHLISEQGLLMSLGNARGKKADCEAVGSLARGSLQKAFFFSRIKGVGPS